MDRSNLDWAGRWIVICTRRQADEDVRRQQPRCHFLGSSPTLIRSTALREGWTVQPIPLHPTSNPFSKVNTPLPAYHQLVVGSCHPASQPAAGEFTPHQYPCLETGANARRRRRLQYKYLEGPYKKHLSPLRVTWLLPSSLRLHVLEPSWPPTTTFSSKVAQTIFSWLATIASITSRTAS